MNHVSVTHIMLKEFEELKRRSTVSMKLLEVLVHTPDINMNKREVAIFLFITKVSFNILF